MTWTIKKLREAMGDPSLVECYADYVIAVQHSAAGSGKYYPKLFWSPLGDMSADAPLQDLNFEAPGFDWPSDAFRFAQENGADPLIRRANRAAAYEDKALICRLLLPALQATRNLHDLAALEYDPQKEIVTATFTNGYSKRANVAADSGTSMIRDIIGQIV